MSHFWCSSTGAGLNYRYFFPWIHIHDSISKIANLLDLQDPRIQLPSIIVFIPVCNTYLLLPKHSCSVPYSHLISTPNLLTFNTSWHTHSHSVIPHRIAIISTSLNSWNTLTSISILLSLCIILPFTCQSRNSIPAICNYKYWLITPTIPVPAIFTVIILNYPWYLDTCNIHLQ